MHGLIYSELKCAPTKHPPAQHNIIQMSIASSIINQLAYRDQGSNGSNLLYRLRPFRAIFCQSTQDGKGVTLVPISPQTGQGPAQGPGQIPSSPHHCWKAQKYNTIWLSKWSPRYALLVRLIYTTIAFYFALYALPKRFHFPLTASIQHDSIYSRPCAWRHFRSE